MRGIRSLFSGPLGFPAVIVSVGIAALVLAFVTASAQGIAVLAVAPPVSGPVKGLPAPEVGPTELDLLTPPAVRPKWEEVSSVKVSAPWQESESKPEKVVYLIFDGGPHPTYTPQVLKKLEAYDARATFFMLGPYRRQYADIVGQVEAAGHRVGSRGETYRPLTRLSDAKVREELRLGGESACYLWPSYLTMDKRIGKILENEFQMRAVTYTVDPSDYKPKIKAKDITEHVLTMTVPDSVVLLHDGGGGPRPETVKALDTILADLTAEGYEFHALPC
ncbi:MAG TPA: polysaccharide deacetylase family protein [Actinopolymorphaceae bacterium]